MSMEHIHVGYVSGISELSEYLSKIKPSELIQVVKGEGFVIIWKSKEEYDYRVYSR